MDEDFQNRLAESCYLNTPESELDGKSLEDYTVDLKIEWSELGWDA